MRPCGMSGLTTRKIAFSLRIQSHGPGSFLMKVGLPCFQQLNSFHRIDHFHKAHHIRNRSSKSFQATCEVRARHRWCLTGTPIHNRLDDYAALLSFVRVPPFTGPYGKAQFEALVSAPMHSYDKKSKGLERLRKLVAATCLRRTKDHVQNQLRLPPRIEREHLINLNSEEQSLYDFFKSRASPLARKFTRQSEADKAQWGTMLSIINFLRLICNHGEQLLPAAMLEPWKTQNPSTIDLHINEDFPAEGYEDPPDDGTPGLPLTSSLPCQDMGANYRPSSKTSALLSNLQCEQRDNQSLSEGTPIKRQVAASVIAVIFC